MATRRRNAWASCLVVALLQLVSPVAAQSPAPAASIDPHAVYEGKCGRCHSEHGADLARQKLKLVSGKFTVARSGRDLEALLKKHHGVQLAIGEWPALASLFNLGLATGGAYQFRCARCHDRAVTLAREKSQISDGRLIVRSSGQDFSAFLAGHGEAKGTEVDSIVQALRFHLETLPK